MDTIPDSLHADLVELYRTLGLALDARDLGEVYTALCLMVGQVEEQLDTEGEKALIVLCGDMDVNLTEAGW